jgi:hypothetical protein
MSPKITQRLLRRNTEPDTVVVYVRSNDNLYTESIENVKIQMRNEELLKIEDLPRMPWRSEKNIYVHHDRGERHGTHETCDSCQYLATVHVDQASPDLRRKRFAGSAKKLYVFQNPLPTIEKGQAAEAGQAAEDEAGQTAEDEAGRIAEDEAGQTAEDEARQTAEDEARQTAEDEAGQTAEDKAGQTAKDKEGQTAEDKAEQTAKAGQAAKAGQIARIVWP